MGNKEIEFKEEIKVCISLLEQSGRKYQSRSKKND